VAVFAAERAAMLDHEIGRLFDERAEMPDAPGACEVELDSGVHAALAKMAVERGLEAVARQQVAKAAQVAAEALGRHRGILPTLPGVAHAPDERGGAEAGLPNFPDLLRDK